MLAFMYIGIFKKLESNRCNQIWPRILKTVCDYGKDKTLKQCKV